WLPRLVQPSILRRLRYCAHSVVYFLFFYCPGHPRDLHSFPTRRSSDLACGNACAAGQVCSRGRCAQNCGPQLTLCSGSCVQERKDRKSTRLNSSHLVISYAVFCLKKKKKKKLLLK